MASYQPFTSLNPTAPNFGLSGNNSLGLNSLTQPKPQATGSFVASNTAESTPAYRINPMGTSAASPQTNITPPSNSIQPKNMKPQGTPATPPPTPVSTPPLMTPPVQQQQQPQTAGAINSFPGLVGALANTASNGSSQVQLAQAQKLAFENKYADIQQNVGSRPNPFGFMTGVGALEKNRYSQLEPAYEQNITNALTGQSQQISGLGTAAGLAAPSSMPLTNQPFYPVEGQYAGNQSLGQRAVQSANINALPGLVNTYQNQQGNFQGIQNLQNGLSSFLGVNDLNPSNIPYVNSAISQILTKGAGDAKYQQLSNYMNDIASRYALYFGQNGDVTNQVRNVANSLINGNANPQSIMEVIQGLNTQANSVMQGNYQQIQNIQNNPSGVNAPGQSQAPGQQFSPGSNGW